MTKSGIGGSALHGVGGTDLVELGRIASSVGPRVLLKLESQNPTGSMKDRMALAMVRAAQADGSLRPGGSVVEYTGGSTGVSLAFVCAVEGIPLRIVSSDAFAREKLDHMRLLGAEVEIIESVGGRMTGDLTRAMVARAEELADAPGSVLTDQLKNPAPIGAYREMADEIWAQTSGQVSAFVQSVGTAGSVRGVGERLRELDDSCRIVAVEPAESAVLSGGETGGHGIDGVGAGFVVPLWHDGVADEIERVSTEEAIAMAVRLGREEGLFGGSSTGANVVAALRLARRLDEGATIVTVMCDTGMKYLSNPAYFGA
ncbi:MAG: cysteine synthase family protein [Gemmatimonadota bacterium]